MKKKFVAVQRCEYCSYEFNTFIIIFGEKTLQVRMFSTRVNTFLRTIRFEGILIKIILQYFKVDPKYKIVSLVLLEFFFVNLRAKIFEISNLDGPKKTLF